MLSLERCREILGCDRRLTDEQLQELRDQLYGLAEIILSSIDGDNDDECKQTDSAEEEAQ